MTVLSGYRAEEAGFLITTRAPYLATGRGAQVRKRATTSTQAGRAGAGRRARKDNKDPRMGKLEFEERPFSISKLIGRGTAMTDHRRTPA